MKRTFALGTAIVALVLGWLLLAPQQLGGPIAVVSTFGNSMLPTYRQHHLVVVRRDTSYEVGQIVAYHSDTLDTVVLHRIVGRDDQGWVTQGDNNDWLDPDRPTADDVIGRAWFAIPDVGRVLEQPRPVRVLLPLAVVAGIMVATRRRKPERDPRTRRRRRARPRHADPTPSGPVLWAGLPTQVGLSAVVLLTLGGVLAVVAWTRPAFQPGVVNYTHRSEFSYTAEVPTGPVYPDGRIDPGEPVFLRLADRLEVAFDWKLDSDTAPADLRGSGQLVAVIEDGSGWRSSLPLGPAVEWTGTQATMVADLDLARIGQLTSRVAVATGLPSSARTVTLTAKLTVDGAFAGVAFTSRVDPSVVLRVDDLRAQLATPPSADSTDDPLAVSETGSVTVPAREPANLDIAGRGMPVATARPTSIVLTGFGLLAAAAAVLLARRTRSWDEHRRIAGHYGNTIVHVTALSSARNRSLVAVSTIDQLVELALQRNLPVLRVPTREGGHGYVVDDTSARYLYVIRRSRTVPPTHQDTPGVPG